MPGPIATQGSMHVCPMCTGTVPHVGGPVSGPCAPNILINNKPAALMGDMCVCVGPPDVIAQGAPNVFFNGVPVACQGDLTAHGGTITVGELNVIIGSASPMPSVTMAKNKIPFPKITLKDRILSSLSGNSLAEAKANQELLSEEEELKPRIYNLQWRKEETVIRDRKVLKIVTLTADVMNIPDGQTASIKVLKPENDKSKEEQVVELTGTVKDKRVTVDWELEDASILD